MAQIAAQPRHEPASRLAGATVWDIGTVDAVPQVLALAAALAIVLITPSPVSGDSRTWLLIGAGIAGLRLASLRSDLVRSTFVLDAVGTALLIGGTGAGHSPFFGLAAAGAWWAARKDRRGTAFGVAFLAASIALVVPTALHNAEIPAAVYQPMVVVALGLLGDQLHPASLPSRWAFPLLQHSAEPGPDSVRVGLSRAIRGGSVPIDVLLTAGQLGLTAMQTELIAYLILGLSNQEIADALSVSEATVRYRLTRLYRVLDVRGRKAAAERARELGLDALVAGTGADADAAPPQNAPK